jgi:membrane-associated protease RseP (regulator of RpoE activity)
MTPRFLILASLIIASIAYSQNETSDRALSESVKVVSTATNLSGIAAILRRIPEDGKIVVVDLIEDGPGAKAGLMINDVITEVDGHPTSGEELERVVTRLRGAPETKVSLKIERSGASQTINIVRDLVRLKENVTPVEIMVKGDRYWIGEQEMDLSMIVKILNDRASRDKSWPIKIKVDKETLDAALQSVLLKCRHANLINFEVISPTNTTDKTTQ